jgi:hypothetical protein
MGLDGLEDALNKIDHNREENTLDFSFNKESLLPAPEFGGGNSKQNSYENLGARPKNKENEKK